MKRFICLLVCLMFIGFQAIMAQDIQISGTVTDASGAPLPGVSIVVKGTTTGTSSNADGNFELPVPTGAMLVFSSVGMKTQEFQINESTTIDVVLEEDILGLEEVMVVAYGTTKKASYTGAATTVDNESIEKLQVSSVTKALQGLASGVQVVNTSGQPGTDATVRIRGIGSVNASAAPMYIVDGVPYGGRMNAINPSDIESITILKDAVSTSLYGSRAANGIIIITTKMGSVGTPTVTLKAQYGTTDRAIPEYDRVSVPDYYELQWEGYRNSLIGLELSDGTIVNETLAGQLASQGLIGQLGGYNNYNVPDDQLIDPVTGKLNPGASMKFTPEKFEDEIFRTGNRQDYQLGISGGTEKTTYYLSMGYLSEEGIVTNSGFRRYSARLNLTNDTKKWLKVGLNLSGAITNQKFPRSSGTAYANVFMYSRMIAPIYPVFVHDNDGNLIYDDEGNKRFDYGVNPEYGQLRTYASNTNPAGTTVLDKRTRDNDNLSGRTFMEFKFLQHFSFRMNLAADYIGFRLLDYQNAEFGDGAAVNGRSERLSTRHFTYTFNQLLNYSNLFGGHSIDVMLGHENYSYKYNYLYAGRTTFPFPGLEELAAAATPTGSTSFEDNYRTEGFLGRLQYNYNNKYYLSGSYRRDGTSRFHKDARWGNFFSVGASWRLTQEAFMQAIPSLNQLKIRASYGTKGNDRFLYGDGTSNYYPWQGLFTTGFDNNTRPGILVASLSAPALRWEKKNSFNTGVDIGIVNRITMTIDFFHDYSADLLFDKPLPISTGISTVPENIGDMKNVGIEFDLNVRVVNTNQFSWDINLNLTHFKNTITKLPEEEIIQGSKKWMEGKSIYDFWIREYAGVNSKTGESLWFYDELETDGNGDPVLDENGEPVKTGNKITTADFSEADRYYVGNALPTVFGGLNNTFQFREFDFSILLAYSLGGKVFDNNYAQLMHPGLYGDHMHVDILNRWTSDNTLSDIPWLDASDPGINGTSTRFLFNADYLIVRNITLGYTVPGSITGRIGIDNLRIFAAGDNLYTFAKKKGLDPVSDLAGVTAFDHVPIRTISFGVNVVF